MAEIEQDPNAIKYMEQYTTLFENLYATHEKEKELAVKCAETEEQLLNCQKELELAQKLAKTDADTIEDLKNQIQQSWKMTDTAHYREQLAQEAIDNLRKQIADLTAELELKNKMFQEDSEEYNCSAFTL